MAEYLKFTVMIGMEYAAAMFLMVSLFKLRDNRQLLKLASMCLILVQVSFVMCQYGPGLLIPISTVIVWMICMWTLFPLSLFHAAIVSIHTYLIFGMIQGSLIFIALLITDANGLNAVMMDVVSPLSVLVGALLAYCVRKRNWGLSFVPDWRGTATPVGGQINRKLIIGTIIAMASFFGSYLMTMLYKNMGSFLALLLLMLPVLGVLVYLLWMKEVQKYAHKVPVVVPKRMFRSGD